MNYIPTINSIESSSIKSDNNVNTFLKELSDHMCS